MENVFEELLAEGTTVDDNGTIETEENDFDHSYDLNLEDLVGGSIYHTKLK